MSQVHRALLFIVVANRDLPECGLHDYNLTREESYYVCVKGLKEGVTVLLYFNWVSLNASLSFFSLVYIFQSSISQVAHQNVFVCTEVAEYRKKK